MRQEKKVRLRQEKQRQQEKQLMNQQQLIYRQQQRLQLMQRRQQKRQLIHLQRQRQRPRQQRLLPIRKQRLLPIRQQRLLPIRQQPRQQQIEQPIEQYMSSSNVRIYILFYNAILIKKYKHIYDKYPWAYPVLIKKQDKTFENAFWKQLLEPELKSQWSSLDMVGVLSWASFKKIKLDIVNDIISNRSLWETNKYYHFKSSNDPVGNRHPALLQILQDVCKSLDLKLGKASYCNYFMCSPQKMEAFINWFEDRAKSAVVSHPLSMTDAKYRGKLKPRELQSLCGVPYYPHIPFVLENLNPFFFDKLEFDEKNQSSVMNFAEITTLPPVEVFVK